MGINAQNKSMVKTGDWNLAEYFNSTWKSGDFRGITVTDNAVNTMNYDDYLSVNNPTGLTGVLIYQDTAGQGSGQECRVGAWQPRADCRLVQALHRHE